MKFMFRIDQQLVVISKLQFIEFKYLQVFDDVCSELAMAILQFFQGKPPEEQVFRCMKALNKFCTIAHRDVPQLVKMIGPEPSKFSGMSARIDTFIESLNARLATVPMFQEYTSDIYTSTIPIQLREMTNQEYDLGSLTVFNEIRAGRGRVQSSHIKSHPKL